MGPENMDRGAQQEQVRSTGDASGHDAARDVGQDDAVREATDSGNRMDDYNKKRDDIANSTIKSNPWAAGNYVRFAAKIWDSNFAMRMILDNYAKTRGLGASAKEAFHALSELNVVAAAHLSEGPIPKAFYAYENLIKQKIEPLLGLRTGDNVGVKSSDISRLIQARHYKSIVDNPDLTKRELDTLPVPIDPETGKVIDEIRNPDGSYRDVMEWEKYMKENMTEEEFARVLKGAEEIRDVYIRERARLVKAGILSQEVADQYATTYPWYNPIAYIEFAEAKGVGMAGNASPFSNVSKGIFALSDEVAVMGALDPLSSEVMVKQLVQNELRIKRNTVAKTLHVLLGEDGLGWLKDVTKKFEKFDSETGKMVALKLPDDVASHRAKHGYISFYENGRRKVYGGIGDDVNGRPAPIQKDLYDFVFGKGGMASKGNYELENWLGYLAGLRRGTLTTFNPVFMVTNGVIDMFTVWLKRGVMPPGVIAQMAKNFDGIVNEADNALVDIMRATGAFQSRTTNVDSYARDLQKRINKGGFSGEVLWADNFSTSNKVTEQLSDVLDSNFIGRGVKEVGRKGKVVGKKWSRTSQVIEQAARMEVAERTIIARLGAPEWNRLKALDRTQFIDELLYSYKETPGIGLVDHPAIREAGMASLDATVNFWRGGEWVRRINPLTYFLNAAMEGTKLPFRAIGVNLHPNIQPVKNPVEGGPYWEYGNYIGKKRTADEVLFEGKFLPSFEGRKRGATAMGEELDITRRTTGRVGIESNRIVDTGVNELDNLRYKYNTDTIPMMDHIRTVFTGKGLGGANASMVRMGGVLSAQATIMGWNLMHADEWGYWDIPGWIKYSGFLILLPPKRDKDGEVLRDPLTGNVKPNFMVIPHRTREWSIISAAPQYMMEELAQTFDKSAEGKNNFKLFAQRLFSEVTPVDNLPLLGNPTNLSTYLKPFVGLRELGEEFENKDYWRDEPIVPYDLQYRDNSDQYQPFTSETIRKVANILPEDSTYASPLRLDHLASSIFGGTGKTALSLPDWIFETVDGIHRKFKMTEPTTSEEQVQHYRSLKTQSERTAYKGHIARTGIENLETFEDELRKPRRELTSLPFISDVTRRYNPPYAGGLREIGERQQESLGYDIDKDESKQLTARLGRIRKQVYASQQEDDKLLQQWAYRKPGDKFVGITPKDWRKNRSSRYDNYDFFKKGMIEIHGNKTIYSLTDEERDNYYSSLYQIATKSGAQDTRLRTELLLAGYYNIRYPEGEDPDFELVNQFYDAREQYINGIINTFGDDSHEYKTFEDARISSMTSMEVTYDNARKVMSPYFNIGRTADTFIPNASPEQKELWDRYMRAESEQEREGMGQLNAIRMFKRMRDSARSRYVLSTIDVNGNSNLDDLLAFWYGDGYYKGKAVTTTGRSYLNHMHGAIIPTPLRGSTLQGQYGQYGSQYGTYAPVR